MIWTKQSVFDDGYFKFTATHNDPSADLGYFYDDNATITFSSNLTTDAVINYGLWELEIDGNNSFYDIELFRSMRWSNADSSVFATINLAGFLDGQRNIYYTDLFGEKALVSNVALLLGPLEFTYVTSGPSQSAAVLEPSSVWLIGLGLLGLARKNYRR